jgi:hypothetical protein
MAKLKTRLSWRVLSTISRRASAARWSEQTRVSISLAIPSRQGASSLVDGIRYVTQMMAL